MCVCVWDSFLFKVFYCLYIYIDGSERQIENNKKYVNT